MREDVITHYLFIWFACETILLFCLTGVLHVYGDKQTALKAVMAMKGSRFKAFCNRKDAENFAKGLSEGVLTPRKNPADKLQTSTGRLFHPECY